VVLLEHTAVPFLVFEELLLFSIMVILTYSSTHSVWSFLFTKSSPTFFVVCVLLTGVRWILNLVLICIWMFLDIQGFWASLHVCWAICVSLFWRNAYSSPLSRFPQVFLFLCFINSLYSLDINLFSEIWFANIPFSRVVFFFKIFLKFLLQYIHYTGGDSYWQFRLGFYCTLVSLPNCLSHQPPPCPI
jgi:hypothetical protein